jgi:UDP-N-acetylmuramoyl-L-alanyl-D-glutamate--2,6-diaminopimelate ligase
MKVKYLEELIGQLDLVEPVDAPSIPIRNICYDSRKVNSDSLFVAIRGYTTDGHHFLDQATLAGAKVAVVEESDAAIPIIQCKVADTRQALAVLAAAFYSPEILDLRLVGITGTNGKTTTSYLVRSILDSADMPSGLIGTIAYHTGKEIRKAWNTTPESIDLYELLYQISSNRLKGCVLEVSSHALEMHRVDKLEFDVAVFTNLTQDHLDFHYDMHAYFQAKSRLFDRLKPGGQAVINADDPYGKQLISKLNKNIITFAMNEQANVRTSKWDSSIAGVTALLETSWGDLEVTSPLIGEFNIENILAAVATGLALNFDLKTIKRGIESVRFVPGRLEPVKVQSGFKIIVDYAHTPDALQKSLRVLQKLSSAKVWVVFGCGGDRDKAKRPIMGKIASDFADRVVITSDNPRSEKPEDIIKDIINGISDQRDIVIETDRRKAILYAMKHAELHDTILVAGKGHEDYQEISGVKHPFDDRMVIKGISL